MVTREAGEPYYTFQKVHEDFYNRLTTDERLTREYRIDTWGEGRFNIAKLPPPGVHARYQRMSAIPLEEVTGFYTYQINVMVWVLINHRDVPQQYKMAELYLGEIAQIFTETPDDWSLDGTVLQVKFGRTDYGQDWAERHNSVLLCSATFAIVVDVGRTHT